MGVACISGGGVRSAKSCVKCSIIARAGGYNPPTLVEIIMWQTVSHEKMVVLKKNEG